MPQGFKVVQIKAGKLGRGWVVYEIVRGPDDQDAIMFFITPTIALARRTIDVLVVGASNVRQVRGFPSQAQLFDNVLGVPQECRSDAKKCMSTTLAVRSGFVVVSGVAAVANASTGNAKSATALARSALAYLNATERRIRVS